MTTGTIRPECRELPIDRFSIALMTSCARKVGTVVERLVCQAGVAIIGRCPGDRIVAQAAVLASVEVRRVLTGSGCAVVT